MAAQDLDGDLQFTERADRHEASFNFRFEVCRVDALSDPAAAV